MSPESKPSLSGFDSGRRSKGTGAVFGKGQSPAPETESGGLCSDVLAHYLSHLHVAPQGRQRPLSVTGRPNSRLSERPPNFFVNMLSVT